MTTPSTLDFEELFGVNAGYVERVFAEYAAQPEAVSDEWRRFFETHLPPEQLPARSAASASTATATAQPTASDDDDGLEPMRGVSAKIAENMAESLTVPTATSTRDVSVKVLEENRRVVNEFLLAEYRGKVSFTHFVAWAMVCALREIPAMGVSYEEHAGKPHRRPLQSINIGLAVDVQQKNGARNLVVPNIKDCGGMNFATFMAAYTALVQKARKGKLAPDDFRDTTCTLTNPGTIGTISSLPRLMTGQSFILATGSIGVPAQYEGTGQATLTELGVSKVMTLTSTYDHRVIQGADSGEYLARMHRLLLGEDGFYDAIFRDLGIPYRPIRMQKDAVAALGTPQRDSDNAERAAKVLQYIRAYRVRGYLLANLDPLVWEPRSFPELEMDHYGLTVWDLDRTFPSGDVTREPFATLREIRDTLRTTYTQRVGVEFMHIVDPDQRSWLRERMESVRNEEQLPREAMLRALDCLVEAEAFERFLHTRFVGHKRFSLEGGETLMPVLDALLGRAGDHGIGRVVLGMAHRGRLNVLAHVLRKSLNKIFSEFEGYIDPESTQGSGDVKYHLGATGEFETSTGQKIDLELACNPSHLEAVNPVVEGTARARQEQFEHGEERTDVLPVLIHGDAAFSGQGVVQETLNMSQLHGYRTGGTVHIIVNNQIGYTTNPEDSRSTLHCTDVAKGFQTPIFHVNGDDALAAVRMIRVALDFRQHFQRDVVLDIVCYRRHGHNEGDEPSFTQPLLYRKIEAHPSVREIYQEYLVRAGVLQPDDAAAFTAALDEKLRSSLAEVRESEPDDSVELPASVETGEWNPPATAVPAHEIMPIGEKLASWPDTFSAHPKIERLFDRRREMVAGDYPVDFATAESLAFGSLLVQGRCVRLAGQDSGRGTFSQRHSVLVDSVTAEKHIPLNFLSEDQARYVVVDSFLSEEAALGFEYGYSVARPECLTLWEAQFGDFCNGAQIQIDQFLVAGEAKWGQSSGLVMLLPHGYDGQGPEHSSARLERFLQSFAEDNIRVANVSTAAQYFHLLRAQALDPVRKPLIVMTPKSLLRQRTAGSAIEALSDDSFQPAMFDAVEDPSTIRRIVLCSGKVYYDLAAAIATSGRKDVCLGRVELLAPWPKSVVDAALARFPDADLVWCQEEPANMGAWTFARDYLPNASYAGRAAAASPATGVGQIHKQQQAQLVEQALATS